MRLKDRQRLKKNKIHDRCFALISLLALAASLLFLLALIGDLASDGLSRISWQFFSSFPSRFAASAGILSAWVGSLLVMFTTALCAIPLGISAGLYLEEYADRTSVV